MQENFKVDAQTFGSSLIHTTVNLPFSIAAMGKQYHHVDETERRLVKNMLQAKLSWAVIQKITGRSPDTIVRH